MSPSVLDHPVISERYFFPRHGTYHEPFWIDCGDARLGCAYFEHDPGAKTVVHFHGNGEIIDDYLDGFPQLFQKMGCNLLLAEYRGYGRSTGTPQLGRMLEDVRTLLAALSQPAEQLILFGRSVGSLFAIKALEQIPETAGLILESAIADPLERLLLRLHPEEIGTTPEGLAASLKTALDIPAILSRYRGPALILHTRHDGLVDVGHAQALAQCLGEQAELTVFPRGSHNDIMFVNAEEYWQLVWQFIRKLPS